MNWIERMYELKGKDCYSQSGEGLMLEYVYHCINHPYSGRTFVDVGAGDGFILSNTRHLKNIGFNGMQLDKVKGDFITRENITKYHPYAAILSIDIDGNDYWILDTMMTNYLYPIVIAEFNPAFTDSRTIKYNPDHVWDGTDYYGFSFEAGKKLAEKHGYKVIFQIADMNMIMVREDLVKVSVPEVTFKQNDFFKKSNRPDDWVMI